MAETFYTTLGVERTADEGAIRRAYRERVKERHPDVSDEPRAPREFKRLTTARDVLTDETERDRYDRLGHDTYVRRHVEGTAWQAESTSESGQASHSVSGQTEATATERATRRRDSRTNDRSPGEGSSARTSSSDRVTDSAETAHAGSGGTGSWWHASEPYRRTPPTPDDETSGGFTPHPSTVIRVGPWLAVHVLLLASALATGWFTYTRAEQLLPTAVPAAAAGLLLIGLIGTLSVMHLVSLLYG